MHRLNHADAPLRLPPCGHPDRLPELQRWRRTSGWQAAGWVAAIEAGSVAVDVDVLTVLAERLDGPSALRLLRWWWQLPSPDPRWPALIGGVRDPLLAAWLRDRLASPDQSGAPEMSACLLPLLGFQRQPQDGALLARWALAPQPGAVRRAALEGLAVGLSAWPQAALANWLRRLATDHDSSLAAAAVDLLARLPAARAQLVALAGVPLDAAVEQRRQRRLAALSLPQALASSLLLVVHGRAGGVVPPELLELAAELERRRRAPVLLQALTGEPPGRPAAVGEASALPLTLVPLMLLPGGHVRHDIPAIAAHWRLQGPVRRLPFLGAWPAWQRALAAEMAELCERAAQPPAQPPPQPLLLHHPLEGPLARRFLAHLEACTGARCVPASYSDPSGEGLLSSLIPAPLSGAPAPPPLLPLALAANRLTDSLASLVGPPLLQRARFRQLLLAELEALP
ncbi:hypothetical protein KBY70_09465 [Cyanobium sp. ATX 6E8]|uniref:CbiX/SirB N-terminal domain-containing protein n=1 Tax=Cyanobium sp. ATX 6E8 TaxID=2823701 RepID=UPI0021BC4C34|nr:CbiX/SirB N-terminal domain-containing protein [Cyanobium sp. ATX 6E8]MCP9942615.1 hypothetical protein [Cyanobium sp. ATX 6E8]